MSDATLTVSVTIQVDSITLVTKIVNEIMRISDTKTRSNLLGGETLSSLKRGEQTRSSSSHFISLHYLVIVKEIGSKNINNPTIRINCPNPSIRVVIGQLTHLVKDPLGIIIHVVKGTPITRTVLRLDFHVVVLKHISLSSILIQQ
jgi:hypothetical protein